MERMIFPSKVGGMLATWLNMARAPNKPKPKYKRPNLRPWLGIPDPESGIRNYIPGIPDLYPGVNIPAKIPAQECLAGARTRFFWDLRSVC
jgi:hypothetical protein